MEEEQKEEQKAEEAAVEAPAEKQPENKVSFPNGRKKKPRKNIKAFLLIVVGLIILGVGGWFLLTEPRFESEPTSNSELTTPETQVSTSSPTPEPIDREEVKIQVLNGTGIAKEATFLQGKLRELGYEDIEVGNADEQEFEATEVTFSSTLAQEVVDEISQELRDNYNEVNTEISDTLTQVDIRIITGLREGQVLPTPEPTAEPTEVPDASATPTPTASPSATPTP